LVIEDHYTCMLPLI
jgi:hypothetical protein